MKLGYVLNSRTGAFHVHVDCCPELYRMFAKQETEYLRPELVDAPDRERMAVELWGDTIDVPEDDPQFLDKCWEIDQVDDVYCDCTKGLPDRAPKTDRPKVDVGGIPIGDIVNGVRMILRGMWGWGIDWRVRIDSRDGKWITVSYTDGPPTGEVYAAVQHLVYPRRPIGAEWPEPEKVEMAEPGGSILVGHPTALGIAVHQQQSVKLIGRATKLWHQRREYNGFDPAKRVHGKQPALTFTIRDTDITVAEDWQYRQIERIGYDVLLGYALR